MLSFLSPLFLVGRRWPRRADRAAPAEARAGGAREVRRGAAAAAARRSSTREKRHLRELLLLALRVAALLLLALAFARPFFATGAALGTVRRHDRRARHVATACRRRAASSARKQLAKDAIAQRAGRRSRRRRDLRRRGRDRREAVGGSRAGGGGDRRGGAGLRRDALPRRAVRRVADSSTAGTAPSSSSPICRRAAGTPAIARRCRRGRRSRSPTSARRRRIWR